jgi:hypothetical protein
MNEMPLLKLLFGSPIFRGILLACAVAGLLGWIAMGIRSAGVDAGFWSIGSVHTPSIRGAK